MTPQTVNAYYHPLKNEIVFPAAILQPPFFNEHADDAVNYGGIGAVIGHEIGHGFDDQGSTCDGDGALRDWWTEKDREAFEERTAALIEQYSELEPEQTPGHKVNGELTIGENIGDLGGLSIAYKAYKIARGDAPDRSTVTPTISGCSSAGARSGRPSRAPRWCCSGWRPTRTPRPSSAATRSSATCRVLRRVRRHRVRRAVAGRGPAGQDLVRPARTTGTGLDGSVRGSQEGRL